MKFKCKVTIDKMDLKKKISLIYVIDQKSLITMTLSPIFIYLFFFNYGFKLIYGKRTLLFADSDLGSNNELWSQKEWNNESTSDYYCYLAFFFLNTQLVDLQVDFESLFISFSQCKPCSFILSAIKISCAENGCVFLCTNKLWNDERGKKWKFWKDKMEIILRTSRALYFRKINWKLPS